MQSIGVLKSGGLGFDVFEVRWAVAYRSWLNYHCVGLVVFFGRGKTQKKNLRPQAAVEEIKNPLGEELGGYSKQTLVFPHGQK